MREIRRDRPVLRLRVLSEGEANWDIARKSAGPAPPTSSPIGVTPRALSVDDGPVTLDDRQSRLEVSVTGLELSLPGDFAQERIVLAFRTRAGSDSLLFADVPCYGRVPFELSTDVDADLRRHRFAFRNDLLRLNNLRLALSGTVAGVPNG